MATYCRITGKSRGLPKPNYFPLLPPISPADAKRLCRITGKSYGLPSHHYIPVLVVAKPRKVRRRGEIVECEDHAETGSLSSSVIGAIGHTILKDFRYVLPVLESNPDLLRILESKSSNLEDNNFVYPVYERKCGLVFPGRLEAAVRDGDVRDIMLAKHNDTLLLKLRKGVSVEVDVKEMSVDGVKLYEGEGPSEAVQKRKKRKTHDANDWRRKIFEDKEKQADSEEERISEIKSKRVKVKSDSTIKGTPVCGWNNVREGMVKLCANLEFDSTVGKMISELTDLELDDFVDVRGSLLTNFLPQSLKVESEFIDLSTSIPGIIQQPFTAGEQIIGFPIAAVIAPFRPFIAETDSVLDRELEKFNADSETLRSTLEKQFHVLAQNAHILPYTVDIPELVKKIEELSRDTSGAVETELGIVLNIDAEKYVAGQFFDTPAGRVFVPGNVMETSVGPCFIPGFLLNASDGETKFLPGRIVKDDDELAATFVAGQMVLTRDGQKFVQGQTVCTKEGVKFIPGQTVVTPDGVKFVPGQVIKNSVDQTTKFVPGHTVMTPEGPQFVPGQFTIRSDSGDIVFVPGQSVLNENSNWEFVPGKSVKTDEGYVFVAGKEITSADGGCQFVPGRVVIENDNVERFVPGLTLDDRFLPGMQVETEEGVKFVEGMLVKNDDQVMFAAGRVISVGGGGSPGIEFDCAKNQDDVIIRDILSDFGICFDSVSNSVTTETDLFGHMIQSAQGVEFFPGDASGLPAGKVIPGRLVKGDEIRFIPGTMIDNKFIPGQFVTIGAEEKFIPGQVIETNDGPKFVPGQVLQTRSGPKFVPGQTMETEDGPKFIPGQIIETKSGPTFIPGQVIYTEEEGSRFVPGQVVDTAEGPRFVPGRVVETGDHVTFIPGQIVETEDGLKFVAPDLEDDLEGGYQFTVQAFEVAQEELKMIQRNSAPYNCSVGEMAIDSKTLQQFAEAGMAVGRQLPVDVPVVNIKSIPLTEVACEVAGRVNLDALYSVKLSHILSNLQQIKQSNVPISGEDINDENLRILLNLTLDCDNPAELLETLGAALENAIKSDLPNKLLIIDSLHAASVDLAVKVCDKNPGKLLTETARKVANKMDLDNLHSLKVTNILSNLQQIKQSHMTIACEELDNISDQHFKTLLNLALHSDDPAEFAETLGNSLEEILKGDPDNKCDIIDSLQDLSADLSVKVCDKKPGKALTELALQVAGKVDAQPEFAKIGRILTNLLQIKQSNVAAIVDEINDEKLKTLVSLALQCTNTSEFLETVGKALEQAITSDGHNKLQIIDSLNTLTADLAVKVHEKKTNQVFNEMARQVANKVDLDPLSSLKLSHILSNLQKIKLSNLILDYENIEDSNAKMLANLAAEYDSPEFLETFGNALEKLMKSEPNKSQVVDNLYALSIDLTSKVRRTSKAFNEAALQVAAEVDVDSVHSTKLRHILSNLQQIKQSNIALANEEIYDENLKNLLNLTQNCDTSADFLQTVGHALEQVIKSDSEKLHAIDSLHALSEDLASKVRDKKSKKALSERSNQIAQKVDLPISAKLGHILSNLQQIKKSGGLVAYENIQDDNLKQLVSLTMDCDTTAEFLETVGNALEHAIKSELGDKLCLVDSLHTASVDLLVEARNLKSGNALSEVAKNVARKVKLDDEVNRVKLSNILSNLQQIKKSAVLAIDGQEIDSISDDGFKTLLNLALECDDSTEFLETLSNALEQTIKSDPSGNKLGVIDSLHSLSSSLASKLCDKDPAKLLAEVASKVSKTIGVDSVQAVKLTNILSNLKQLRKFNTIPEIENNDRFKYLLDLALHCEDDSLFPETVGLALEKLIKSDLENKLRVIDSLHDFSVEVVNKVGDQSRSAILTQMASKLAQKLDIDELNTLKVANILSNIKQLKQSDIPVVLECVKNENLRTLLTVALQNDVDDELPESLASALEIIIEADQGNKLDIIDSLHTLSTDVVRTSNNEVTRAVIKARKLAEKANLDPLRVTKLTNIFTNLQQIKKSGVAISKAAIENADEKFQTILNLVSEDSGLDFSETLGSALKELFNCEGNKAQLIDALHDLSVDLAVNTNKVAETRVVSQMAKSLAKKMNLQGEEQSAKLTNIMSVLQQVSKSNVTADDVKKIPDKKFKQLVNLALKSDPLEFMQIIGCALEKVIEADPENASQLIDTLHMQSATCAVKLLNKDVTEVIAQSAAKLAKEVKVDGLNSLKLTNIMTNLQELGNADLKVIKRELENVTDEKFKTLVCEAMEGGNIEKLGLVLERMIKNDLENKCDVIESLHSLTSEFAQKTIGEVPCSLVIQKASAITKKIPCSSSQSAKLAQILANLQRITESSLDVSNGEVKDKHLKQLLKLASQCKNSEEVLDTLANSLERVLETNIADKDRLIESLHVLTIDLLSKAKDKENKEKFEGTVVKIARNVDLDDKSRGKVSNVISNLIGIRSNKNVKVNLQNIEDENLKTLVQFALESSKPELLENLSDALERAITANVDNKAELIDSLHTLSSDLALQIRQESANQRVSQVASQLANKIDVDQSHSLKLDHILSNLQQIEHSNADITVLTVCDENLRKLIAVCQECEQPSQLLDLLSEALEQAVASNPDKLQLINTLHISSAKLAVEARQQTAHRALESKVNKIGAKVDLDQSYVTKLGHILTNLEQIKNAKVSIPVEIKDQNLKDLLNLALTSNDSVDFLETVSSALEQTLLSNATNKNELIDSLHVSSSDLAIQVQEKESSNAVNVMSQKVAKRVHVGRIHATKINQILSSLQQINSNGIMDEQVTDNETLKNLLTLASECQNPAELLQTLGDALEQAVNLDPSNKLQIIDSLHASTVDLAVKSHLQKETKAVTKMARKVAENVENTVDALQMTKLSNILTNLRQIKDCEIAISEAELDGTDQHFKVLLNSALEKNNSNFTETVGNVLEQILKSEGGNKSELVDTLHALSVDWAVKASEKARNDVLPQMARSLANKLQLDDEQVAKLTNIMTTMEQVKHSNIGVDEIKKISDKPFKQMLNLVLKSGSEDFADNLYSSLELAIKADPKNAAHLIDSLHNQSVDISIKMLDTGSTKAMADSALKIAKELKVDELNSVKLFNILSNVKQIKDADPKLVAEGMKNIVDENLKTVLNQAFKSGDNAAVSRILEEVIKSDLDNKLAVIESLHSVSSDLALKTADIKPSPALTKIASQITEKIKGNAEQSMKILHILADLQQIKVSNVDYADNDIKDKHLKQLLKLATQCKNPEELAQTFGTALGKILSSNIAVKDKLIESLHASTIDLANKVKEKAENKKFEETVTKMAQKMDLDNASCGKLNRIISNLTKIQSEGNVNVENIEDENLKTLVKAALDSSKPKLLENLSQVLERTILENVENKSQVINSLHTLSANLALQGHQGAVNKQVTETASQLAAKTNVGDLHSVKLGHILSNLQQIKQSNADIPLTSISDENLKQLLIVSQKCNNPSQLLELLSDTLELTILSDSDKLQLIDTLHASSAQLAVETRQQTAHKCLKKKIDKIAKKHNLSETHSVKLTRIFANLQQIKDAGIPIPVKIENQHLKTLVNSAIKSTNRVDFLETVSAALEQALLYNPECADQLIDSLDNLSCDIVVLVEEKKSSEAVTQTAHKLAAHLKVDKVRAAKLGQILNNLQKIKSVDCIPPVGNEHLQTLLNVVSKCQNPNELLSTLGNALEKVVKSNPSDKLRIIDDLHTLTVDLVVESCHRNVTKMAEQVAKTINFDPSCSAKLSQILSNLQQMQSSEYPISDIKDENLKNLVMLASTCKNPSELLQNLGSALEKTIVSDSRNKTQVIDSLHAATVDLAVKIRDQKATNAVTKVAHQIANSVNQPASVAKLSQILANVQQIKQSNISVNSAEVGNEDLQKLLTLAGESDPSEVLDVLGNALEQVLQSSGNKSQLIDALHMSSVDLSVRLSDKKSNKSLTQMARHVADKVNLDTLHFVKLGHILSNLQQILQSNVSVSDEEIKDKTLKTLMNLTSECENNTEFLETAGKALERAINSDPSNKVKLIDSLHTATVDLAVKVRNKKPNKVLLLKSMIKGNVEPKHVVIDKLISIFSEHETAVCAAFQHMCQENPEFVDKVLENIADTLKSVKNEKEAVDALHRAIIKAVTETSESKVQKALNNKKSDDFNSLVNDAVGLAKALGLGEVVTILNDVLKDGNCMKILAKDAIVMEVLKRLTVMRQLAETRPNLGRALKELHTDPYAARSDPRLRELVRESAMLMVIPEESLVLRSSADIPSSILFSDNSLAVEDFMVKTRQCGATFLILKKGLQAVIPREAARDVLTGQVPYTVLDENGIHYFKPCHVFNALKLPKFATNRFSNYTYIHPALKNGGRGGSSSYSQTRGSSASVEDLRKTPSRNCVGREGMEEEFILVKDFITDDEEFYADKGERVKVLKTDDDDPTLSSKSKKISDDKFSKKISCLPRRGGLMPTAFVR